MKRRAFVAGLGNVMAWPMVTWAQQSERTSLNELAHTQRRSTYGCAAGVASSTGNSTRTSQPTSGLTTGA